MEDSTYILISGRNRDDIDLVGRNLANRDDFDVKIRHLTGGLPDPLFGLKPLPDILVMILSENWQLDLELIYARPETESTQIIVVGNEENPQMMRMAMQAGVRDYFSHPIPKDEFLLCIERIARSNHKKSVSQTIPQAADGAITAVINSSGGSGSSLISANLAHIMVTKLNQHAALLDMDLQFGSLPSHLNLEPKESLIDALLKVNEMDALALEGYMAKHSSGLHLLASKFVHMPQPWTVSTSHLMQLLKLVRGSYEQIVIDLPRVIDPFTNTILEEADNILIVLEQRITHINSTNRMLRILTKELAIPTKRIHLVMNRFDKKIPLVVNDVSEALDIDSVFVIPNDYERVLEAVNMGVPLSQTAKNTPIVYALNEIAEAFTGQEKIEKKGFFKKAFSQLIPA
ncbi:MAG: CpaE family protein [Gammaproteobacteria bacterium]